MPVPVAVGLVEADFEMAAAAVAPALVAAVAPAFAAAEVDDNRTLAGASHRLANSY